MQSENDTDGYSTTVKSNKYDQASTTTDTIAVRRRLKRKLDLRLVIWAFLGYFASWLDRSNLRNGMKEDLLLESSVYNWADTVMSLGYNL
ncbi:hypothetical protein LRAMOSA06969 [Lichtheimia ramosa]|uniref:Major facilitator superfamily (MFS) profile domain-containing protein n=1 Tax=Lichtheimia ramosa TaxID=688394 RepID=A0A077WBL0_9FUNG|nr:hypothetical protein LRAMOSA06969 [Lichtheimia ramosa]